MLKNLKLRTKLSLMIFIPLLSVLIISIMRIININKNFTMMIDTYYNNLYKTSVLISNFNKEMLRALALQNDMRKDGVNAEYINSKRETLKTALKR